MKSLKTTPGGKSKPVGYLPQIATSNLLHEFGSAFSSLADGFSMNPLNWLAFKAKYQAESWLSKYCVADPKRAEFRKDAAIKKWLSVDFRNERSNFRIQFDDAYFRIPSRGSDRTSAETVLELARGYVTDIIGEEPPLDLFEMGQFTNGASTRISRSPDAIARKFVGKADVTPSAWPYFESLLEVLPGWGKLATEFGFEPNFVDSSIMFTVPKNSEIDRVACKEPEINMFLQRAIGNYFRKSLLKKGRINLNDQTINQKLSRYGSYRKDHPLYRPLATIDLSSASDSVTTSLVSRLLPPSWFVLLNDTRVKTTVLPDGTVHELNMFSSMGNGFTFELESLIFLVLARATTTLLGLKGRVSVYGDDIIVPNDAAPRLKQILLWFGFKVNPSKSFWKGKFRESCGAHWFLGHDVTPFYLREPLNDQRDLINQLNQLREWICRESVNGLWTYDYTDETGLSSSIVDAWRTMSRYVWTTVHGGRDLEASDSLVTPAIPRKRFIARPKVFEVIQTGAFLHWLQVRDRISEDAVTSEAANIGRLFLSSASPHSGREYPTDWLFLHELEGVVLLPHDVCITEQESPRTIPVCPLTPTMN